MSGCSSGATLKKRVEELAVFFLGRYCVFGLYFNGATLKQGMDNYHRRRNDGHGDRCMTITSVSECFAFPLKLQAFRYRNA